MTILSLNGSALDASVDIDSPYAPVSLVTTRFTETLTQAQQVLALLIGSEGDGGLIGEMEAALSPPPATTITPPDVDTAITLDTSGAVVPVFDHSTLVEAPNETYATPTLVAVPTVDVDFSGITLPADITLSMTWAEATLPAEVFAALKTQILADLVDGSTGITEEVETAIYTRARNRQQADRLAAYNRIATTAAQLQHALPTGVLVALQTDFEIGANRQDADIEYGIIEQQAKLAQDNRKSAMQQAVALEQLIRQTRNDESGRALEGAKTLATLTLQEYAEKIKAFQASWEGKKAEVQARVEAVRAAVETNTGLIDVFKALYDSLKTRVEAAASYNKSLTDVFVAETQGFGEAEKAISDRNSSKIKLLEQQIADADLTLRGAIAEANNLVAAYQTESSIKERVSSDRAQVAAHVAAALLSAVSASASLGYTGSEHSSKSFGITVSGQENHSYQEV